MRERARQSLRRIAASDAAENTTKVLCGAKALIDVRVKHWFHDGRLHCVALPLSQRARRLLLHSLWLSSVVLPCIMPFEVDLRELHLDKRMHLPQG